ncbi:MAG: DUF58 domain-containing protein [Nitriliruptorales bacterium]
MLHGRPVATPVSRPSRPQLIEPGMLTDRGKLLLLTAGALWLLGRSFGIDEVSMAALACLVLVALAVLFTRLASLRLSSWRHVRPTRLWFDEKGSVDLEIRNEGWLPTALLLLEDETAGALAALPRFVLEPLGPGRAVHMRYSIQGRQRGLHTVGPARMHLRDPFGVAQRPLRFDDAEQVVVYPPVLPLPSILPRLGRLGTTTEGTARPVSTSGEFANVREYVRGDDLRKVHWKSTAHRGKLMLKQEESPFEVQATLVLDARRIAHGGSGPASTFETVVTAAASAAYHLSERRYELRFCCEPLAPPVVLGWETLLERLAVLQPIPATTLTPLWRALAERSVGEGLLVSVGPVPEPAELREMVRTGRAFGGKVAVLVAAASERGGRRAGGRETPELALAALRGAGWRATVHRPGLALADSWQELALRPLPSVAAFSRTSGPDRPAPGPVTSEPQ